MKGRISGIRQLLRGIKEDFVAPLAEAEHLWGSTCYGTVGGAGALCSSCSSEGEKTGAECGPPSLHPFGSKIECSQMLGVCQGGLVAEKSQKPHHKKVAETSETNQPYKIAQHNKTIFQQHKP